MIEVFIEVTNQIYWEGYAEQLSEQDPERFLIELNEFLKDYKF